MQYKKILIVEDEMIIAADISMQLSQMGYKVVGIQTSGESAIAVLKNSRPDLILMDIMLAGELDGIETAKHIVSNYNIPIIYLTSNTDDATFDRAIKTRPFAFVSKPFQRAVISRNLKIAFQHIANEKDDNKEAEDQISTLNDRLFIRQKEEMIKVFIRDILYLEAERSYCKVYTKDKEYFAVTPMGTIEAELPPKKFIRSHRSFIINIDKIDAIGENKEFFVINGKNIPVSRRNREEILKRLKLI